MSMTGRVIEAVGSMTGHPVEIHKERCVKYRHKASTCTRCVCICPASALGFDSDGVPVIDEQACSACGACTAVCPTEALSSLRPKDAEVLDATRRAVEAEGAIVYACAHAGATSDWAVNVPCLARLDVPMLLLPLSGGASKVSLACGNCDACSLSAVAPLVRGVAQAAGAIARDLGLHGSIEWMSASSELAEATPVLRAPLSRKAFLRTLARGGASISSRAVDALLAPELPRDANAERLVRSEFPVHVSASRARLVSVLESLPREPLHSVFRGFLFSTPSVAEELCVGCSMCATVCPTGALVAIRDGADFSLTFDARICTSCYLCKDVCPNSAISRRDESVLCDLANEMPTKVVEKHGCEDPLSIDPDEKLARLFSATVSHA
ncbi:MAG: 4Fe-4S binding protein [Coriobacteriia bacterium]